MGFFVYTTAILTKTIIKTCKAVGSLFNLKQWNLSKEGYMRMSEKYSTFMAYLWSIPTTIYGATLTMMGIFTLEQWVAVIGIVCTIGTFLINLYYRRREYKLKERQYENTEKNIDGNGW